MDDREESIAMFQKECIDCYGELLRAEMEKALDERYEFRNDEEVMFDEDDTSVISYDEDVLEYNNRKIENANEWDWMNGMGMNIFKVMEKGNTKTIWRSVVKYYERMWSKKIDGLIKF